MQTALDISDSICTFEVLNYHSSGESCPENVRGFFVAFLLQNDIAERRSFLYREGLKTFALEWVEQRCKGDRRFSFASPVTRNAQKLMLHQTKVAEGCTQYTPNAEAIKEFFACCGSSKEIEETMWDMLQSSLSNPDDPTEHHQNAARTFLYRRLKELLEAIEPVKFSKNNLTNN